MNLDMVCDEVELLPPTSDVAVDPYELVSIHLSWTAEDPHAVTTTFVVGPQVREGWVLSLELLTAGLLHPAGEGDVFLSPDPFDFYSVVLVLSTNSGRVGFRMPVEFLTDFISDVDKEWSDVAELDWDSELARWLEDA